MDGFGIFLTDYKTSETIQLPVNPADIEFELESDDKSQTVVNLGEINRLGKLKLMGVTIESVLPDAETTYTAVSDLQEPQFYIDYISKVQKTNGHMQLVVSDTKISMPMTVSSFKHGFSGGFDEERKFTLKLKQYRSFKAKKLKKQSKKKKKKKSKKGKSRISPPKKFGVGSNVVVNGRLYMDSNGNGPGGYEKNARRKVINIATGHKFPICVGINGATRGWVKKSDVRKA